MLTKLTKELTNSKEQSPSWEANRYSASQEIPHIWWNPVVYYRIYKIPPPVPIVSHINTVSAHRHTSWTCILILSSHLSLGLSSGLYPSRLPIKTVSPTRATLALIQVIITNRWIFIRITDEFLHACRASTMITCSPARGLRVYIIKHSHWFYLLKCNIKYM